MGTIPGMTTSAPPDPSQKIPPEARGRVRRKKKNPGSGGAGRGTSAGLPSLGGMGTTGMGEGGEDDRTFVTSRGVVADDSSNISGKAP